jgi:hypothetical protein
LQVAQEDRFMKSNRLLIACYGSLILMGFAGCRKKVISQIDVDRTLAPLSPTPPPGKTLEWLATTPGLTFDVSFESGLCTQKSPIHASYDHPAVCTIAPQTFRGENQANFYTYRLDGNVDGKPRHMTYRIAVGPGGCPHCRL